ncbi:MAG: hypothetical protein WA783_03615, partial [Phormidesmis sp.]
DAQAKAASSSSGDGREKLAFEPGKRAVKAEVSGSSSTGKPMKSAEPKTSSSKSKKRAKKKTSK